MVQRVDTPSVLFVRRDGGSLPGMALHKAFSRHYMGAAGGVGTQQRFLGDRLQRGRVVPPRRGSTLATRPRKRAPRPKLAQGGKGD